MKLTEFIKTLEIAASVPSYYNNKFPYNCGYYDGEKYSFDCWNMIKSILGGWKSNGTVGSYVSPKDFPTGDCTGLDLLNQCSGISQDFAKLKKPGTYLYMRNHPHSGVYVGEHIIDGKTYNVIECTSAWDKKVLYSYVDEKGGRYQYKGGKKCYAWTDYGWLPYVEAESTAKPCQTREEFPEKLPYGEWYRVRLSWPDVSSQVGAFQYKANAIEKAKSKSKKTGKTYHIYVDGVEVDY